MTKLFYLILVLGGIMLWFVFNVLQALSILLLTIGLMGYFLWDKIKPPKNKNKSG